MPIGTIDGVSMLHLNSKWSVKHLSMFWRKKLIIKEIFTASRGRAWSFFAKKGVGGGVFCQNRKLPGYFSKVEGVGGWSLG